jgi:hypothetical protein
MNRLLKNLAFAFALLSLTSFCGNDDDSTSAPTISVPDLRPTVQAALSSTLISGGTYAQALEAESATNTSAAQAEVSTCNASCSEPSQSAQLKVACEARNRMFCTSTFEILDLINQVDSQLAEIERRSTGVVDCMSAALTDSTSEVTFPGSETIPHKLQCKDIDTTYARAWGQDTTEDTWYLRGSSTKMAYVASIEDEDEVEGYFWIANSDFNDWSSTVGLVHLKARKNTKFYEMTGGGEGMGFCGFHMRSNADYIYIIGNRSTTGACDSNQDSATTSADWVEVCLKSDFTFSDGNNGSDASACDSIDEDNFTLKTLYRGATKIDANGTNASTYNGGNYTLYLTTGATPPTMALGSSSFDIGYELSQLKTTTSTINSSIATFTVTSSD